jgi:hypothetical protein
LQAIIGVACALAGLVSLPYVGLAIHDVFDVLRGRLHGREMWGAILALSVVGILSIGAFVMAYRFLRYAFARKSLN